MNNLIKKTTLFISIIALLTACDKNEDLLPLSSQQNPSYRTSNNQGFLYTIEKAHYNIKSADFYQYHLNASYISPGDSNTIEHISYDKGELKVANDGTGYLKSNIYPNDMIFPFRPWGSSSNYNQIFNFTITDYSINNDTVVFDLYIVPCNGDTTFFTSTMKIIPLPLNNKIRLEQIYGGIYWDRKVIYELEKTTNGGIKVLVEKKKH